MFQISQSIFLQALGYSIINSIWQFGFLWLIYLLLNCVASLSSHKKYAAAISLQLAGFLWFVITFIFYYNKCTYLVNTGTTLNDGLISFGQMPYTGSIKDRILLGILSTEAFLPYLSLAYIIIFFFLVLRWAEAFRITRSLHLNGLEKIDVEFRLFVEKLSHQLGIKRSVSVFLSHHVKSPLTIGFLKPVILIPFASLNNLSCEQIEAVLLHELAHIKRSDYLINLILSVIEVVLFFNPFMQLISRHIKRERENSCDDWVLQFEYNASNYAKALLVLATFNRSCGNPLTMNAVDQKHSLLIRVKRMIEKKDRTFNYRNQLITLLGLAILMSFMAWITPRSKQLPSTTSFSYQLFVPEPMAAKIDNPFFNPVFFLAEKTHIDLPPFEKQAHPGDVSKNVSIFKIVLPAFKTMQSQKEKIIDEAHETVGTFENKNHSTAVEILDRGAKNQSPFAAIINETAFENFDLQLNILDREVKKVENYLKLMPVTIISGHENELAKQEVQKALQSLKTSITQTSNNKTRQKQQLLRSLQDSAETYFKLLFNKKALAAMNEQFKAKLEQVAEKKEAETYYNNWKALDKPATIMFTPNVEQVHTFSYDYKETPNIIKSRNYSDFEHQDLENRKADVQIEDDPAEVIEVHIAPAGRAGFKSSKKIIKRIRI